MSVVQKGKPVKVAIVGSPNTGKTTLVNALAGTKLRVGNWPGVTVDVHEARIRYQSEEIDLVDLPGIYSLNTFTPEEKLTRDFLQQKRPDVIVNIVDATHLERNLSLTFQLMEFGLPMVLVLNMMDEARQKGMRFNLPELRRILGYPVIETVSTKKEGLDLLQDCLLDVRQTPSQYMPKRIRYSYEFENAIQVVEKAIEGYPHEEPLSWLAIKFLEGDDQVVVRFAKERALLQQQTEILHLTRFHGSNLADILAQERSAKAAGLTREVVERVELASTFDMTEWIDRFALNSFWGLPIFGVVMWGMFTATFKIAMPMVDVLDAFISGTFTQAAEGLLAAIAVSPWLKSLLLEGLIGGVGAVLAFVPVIFVMMLLITLLEGSGYMARAAFVMDKVMHLVGLHGKSFIPLIMGFGCNVPSVYATRVLESERDRRLTALLIPLVSCSARLPVYGVFAGLFFPRNAGTIIWILYMLGLGLALLMGVILSKTIFRREQPLFIMELPPYRIPTLLHLWIHSWEKARHFVVKAGSYIMAASILIWFLFHFPWGVEDKHFSYLGQLGQFISPILAPLGFGFWQAGAALITGVVAKEVVVSTLGNLGDMQIILPTLFTPLSAFSFMVFVLLYMPCVVVGIAYKHELGQWKWLWLAIAYGLVLAWTTSFVIFQVGRLMGLP